MKRDKLIYGTGAAVVIGGAVMNILHLPGAELAGVIAKLTFVGMFLFISLENAKLKKRIAEIEA